jgi:hypothetical protein
MPRSRDHLSDEDRITRLGFLVGALLRDRFVVFTAALARSRISLPTVAFIQDLKFAEIRIVIGMFGLL